LEQCNKIPVALAVYEFMKDLGARRCTEATEAKYRVTLYQLIHWCQDSRPPILLLFELNVRTVRAWLQTVKGASLIRHHEHERGHFFYFCVQKGWLEANPATRIRNLSIGQRLPAPPGQLPLFQGNFGVGVSTKALAFWAASIKAAGCQRF